MPHSHFSPPVFDPLDPYPLLAHGEVSYASAQQHAAEVDAWLGSRAGQVEVALARDALAQDYEVRSPQQRWIGLPLQALQTPYIELRRMMEDLRAHLGPAGHVVDLGAGYGRLGLVVARHYPALSFTGFECVRERVQEGQRVYREQRVPPSIALLEADVSDAHFALPRAQAYFVYDFGHRVAIDEMLERLRMLAQTQPVVVVGRGRATRDAIERRHPWLCDVVVSQNFGNYAIYRSA